MHSQLQWFFDTKTFFWKLFSWHFLTNIFKLNFSVWSTYFEKKIVRNTLWLIDYICNYK
jgi:hypothetical protein